MYKASVRAKGIALGLAAMLSQPVLAETPPTEFKLGITTFLSGPASVFGKPAAAAAELYINHLNEDGGILGVKIEPIFIDEGVGGDRLLSEYRRVVQEEKANAMMASISSGNCKSLVPVAEDLKIVNVMWDCGTEKIFEEDSYTYSARTQANAVQEMLSSVVYLLKVNPDFKTIAVVNQDYSWGRDSWDIFINALRAMKPDVEVVAELFPKFGSTDFSAEISRLQVLRPDVILSTSWGGDLDTFVQQAAQRGLTRSSQLVLPLAESSLERLGTALPENVIIGARGDHYFLHPKYKNDPEFSGFIKEYKESTGSYPIYSSFHMVQGLAGLKAAYEKAYAENNDQWPSQEQVAKAFRGLKFKGLTSEVTIQADGQGVEDQLFGLTTKSKEYPFMILKDVMVMPGALFARPLDAGKGTEWVKTLNMTKFENIENLAE
ncbi:ABC transporter substrate-binding protein [Marinobacterium rhizophilum]|uniref:ABC transporter substrate-binding protein n=1 Tax=Marinobacterium rhizophilum TaxID=420402 RepID=UPI00037E284D|nr:ABC transporter substrate-binding protein [Marinobacterium rhizophilum]